MSTKNPVTPAGIEPGTFRFVAQRVMSVYYIFRRVYVWEMCEVLATFWVKLKEGQGSEDISVDGSVILRVQ